MTLLTRDVELELTAAAAAAAGTTFAAWPGMRVDRVRPAGTVHLPLITFTSDGGTPHNIVYDWLRVAVNVYAVSDTAASRLARTVRAWLEGMAGVTYQDVQANAPAPVPPAGTPPHWYMSVRLLARKEEAA